MADRRPGQDTARWTRSVYRTEARRPVTRSAGGAVGTFWTLAWLGAIVSVALVVPVTTRHDLVAPGGLATAVGRVTGLLGTYLLLIAVLLIGRIPAVERALGQAALVRAHARLGPWVLVLLSAHAVFITVGYAQGVNSGALHELAVLSTTFPGMLGAVAGLGLLLMAGFTSYRYVQRRMRYETWWVVHLYTYLGAAVAFSHQLSSGAPLLGHPLARTYWVTLWLLTAGVVLTYRVGLPVARTLYHRIRVVSVQYEAPGVVSLILRGHRLDRLPVAGGQFLQWRFLRRGLWWQAHPFSLSALPTAEAARITVRISGEHSARFARLEPGTRVAIEGPYGAFTHHARATDRVVLVAAGVGSAPIRAMLDDLPRRVDVDVILRGSTADDLVLGDEIADLVRRRGGRLHRVVGPRSRTLLDAAALRRLVPDVNRRDLYVCGPTTFSQDVLAAARRLGIPEDRLHHEDFAA